VNEYGIHEKDQGAVANIVNQLDLFKNTVNHVSTGSFLYSAHFVPHLLEQMKVATGLVDEEAFASHFGTFSPVSAEIRSDLEQTVDFTGYFDGVERPTGSYITSLGVLNIPGSQYHFTRYISPLRNAQSLADVEAYPWQVIGGLRDDGMAESVAKAHAENRVATCWVGHMYEDAWQIRGYEEFLMDMLVEPQNCEFILDRLCERNTFAAISGAKAGVDMIMSGDDVASQRSLMFDADVWRRFNKSRWARVYAAARAVNPNVPIWYHSDGNIEEIIPDLIEIGVTILNPVQPECVDVDKLKREYGKHLVFDGTIGTQTTMPFGSPEDVRRMVRERKRSVGYDGALILSPTHVLEPEVPVGNVLAFLDEAAAE